MANLSKADVVIAHRPSTIRHADRIYVLAEGRVVQCGRYEALHAVPGPFRDLVFPVAAAPRS